MASASVLHNVPIWGQPREMACWYTSYQMVVAYERSRGRGQALKDPSESLAAQAIYEANTGMSASNRAKIAAELGFVCDYISMSQEGMLDLLGYAPVIYGGKFFKAGREFAHVVVLVGMSESTLAYNDPLIGREFSDYDSFMGTHVQRESQALIRPS